MAGTRALQTPTFLVEMRKPSGKFVQVLAYAHTKTDARRIAGRLRPELTQTTGDVGDAVIPYAGTWGVLREGTVFEYPGDPRRKGTRPSEPGHTVWGVRTARRIASMPNNERDLRAVTFTPGGPAHRIQIAHSEAAMHMGLAGKFLPVVLDANGRTAWIYAPSRRGGPPARVSITYGEAGIYRDQRDGTYTGYARAAGPGNARRKSPVARRNAARAARRRSR